MKNSNGFKRYSGCFKCENCGRMTRSTGDNYITCPECYELAGQENILLDKAYSTLEERQAIVNGIYELQNKIVAKGGINSSWKGTLEIINEE